MTTHAHWGEDIWMWEALDRKSEGFFVDVGANDPIDNSVSKFFYDQGWRGINIEPLPWLAEKYAVEQPESVTLACAMGETAATELTIYYNPTLTDWTTGDARLAQILIENGLPLDQRLTTSVTTLKAVLDQHAGGRQIDWLKVDVEGMEGQVLRGNDWTKYRPTILCIESFDAHAHAPTHEAWEPLLLDVGYQLEHVGDFDRFYRLR